jgi:putative protease
MVPEILAPAGDRASLAAALAAGADAVYFGLDDGFNARARATNFAAADLPEIMRLIHRAGARGYVTLNTLVFESELTAVETLLAQIAAAEVDAIIVQDPAVALLARSVCSELEVHASTQMTVSSPLAADLLAPLRLARIVAPRELSVADIAAYARACPVPLEVFIHGALCVSWSGQCLTSESWAGRSANRGQCSQSCRLPYDLIVDGERRDTGDVRYLLSPRDLLGLDAAQAVADAGAVSLKIEGRLKGPAYVAAAVTAYRERVRGVVNPQREAELLQVYSRGGSSGFLLGADHQTLVEGRSPRHRGLPLGRVTRIRDNRVWVQDWADLRPITGGVGVGPRDPMEAAPGETSTLRGVPRPGMGVVFDQGKPELEEQGGPIFAVDADGPGSWVLRFGIPGPDLSRIVVGDRVWLSSDPELLGRGDREARRGQSPLGHVPVQLSVTGEAGHPLSAIASAPHVRGGTAHTRAVSTAGALAAATGQGLTQETLADKLGGFGGTDYHLAGIDASALAPGLHVPVSQLKDLRRQLVVLLDEARFSGQRSVAAPGAAERLRADLASSPPPPSPPTLVALCRNDSQLDAALDAGCTEVELDWMELVGLGKAVARARGRGATVVVATLRVQKPGDEKVDAHLARLEPDGVLVRSWGSLGYFRSLSSPPTLHGDFSLNVTNSITARWLRQRGLATITGAHDLDTAQLEALLAAAPEVPFAVTVHHHIATFHTEHCVYAHTLSTGRDFHSCGRPCEKHELSLADRIDLVHPVLVDVACRNTVFNAQAQSAAGLVPRLLAAGVRRFRVELVRETAAETASVIHAYRDLLAGTITGRAVVDKLRAHEQFGVTRGTMRTLAVVR